MYSLRMLLAFAGTAFIPYFLHWQLATIPLTLGVVAAGLSDIDDRFSVRWSQQFYSYIAFFVTALWVQLLFPHPVWFAVGLVSACIIFILVGALGRRFANIAYGCLVISVYAMLGHGIFAHVWMLPLLLVAGAFWYGLVTRLSVLLFPVQSSQQQLAACYAALAQFLFVKANLMDVDNNAEIHRHNQLELALENGKVVHIFNEMKLALLARLKGDRGQKITRRSLHFYFVAQDIHERVDSAHIDYLKLSQTFRHSDILFRLQRILLQQSKACQDLSRSLSQKQPYVHNSRFAMAFEQLNASLLQLKQRQHLHHPIWIKALYNIAQNLKSIDDQLFSLASGTWQTENINQLDLRLNSDEVSGWKDSWLRIQQHLQPESVLFRHAIRLSLVLLVGYIFIQVSNIEHGYWILLTALFVCQPNFNATKRRLRLRILGTLLGISAGYAILNFVPDVQGQLFVLMICGVLFFHLRSQQYAQATAFITIVALMAFNLEANALQAIVPRLLDTLIGCGLAWLAVYFIWPDWQFRNLGQTLNKAIDAECQYFAEVVQQYATGRNNAMNYRIVRRAAHRQDAELASLVSTLSTDPEWDALTKQNAFEFLSLNHSLLSYVSALGAHRAVLSDATTLHLLQQANREIADLLLHDQHGVLNAEQLRQHLRLLLAQESTEPTELALVVLQQLCLIYDILPRLHLLKQDLMQPDAAQPDAAMPVL